MSALWQISFPWWHFVLRAAVVYIVVLFLLRLGGKQQVGQMGMPHFAALLLISNAVQNSMNGGDNSVTGGIILAAVLVGLAHAVSYLTFRSRKAEYLIQGRPTLLVHNGKILYGNLRYELLNVYDLKTHLRRQGVEDVSDVAEAILESDGSFTILKNTDISHYPDLSRAESLGGDV